jgi:MoaA/NifB/PqqE/SkfB family radical SAM enzyme
MRPDFSRYPLLVAWEMTQACPLVCQHCRASAVAEPPPGAPTGRDKRPWYPPRGQG